MPPLFLLHFPRLSDSATFRAYLADLGGFRLLGWWIPQLVAALSGETLVALYHDAIDGAALEPLAAAHRFAALPSTRHDPLVDYCDAMRAFPGRSLVAFNVGAFLLPPSFLPEFAARHLAEGSRFTRAVNCPPYCQLEAFDLRSAPP
jgi:hypothetical protein